MIQNDNIKQRSLFWGSYGCLARQKISKYFRFSSNSTRWNCFRKRVFTPRKNVADVCRSSRLRRHPQSTAPVPSAHVLHRAPPPPA